MEKDESYIPVSARVKFTLKAVNEAEETPEFIALRKLNETFTTNVQLEYKKHIIDCAKIEEKALKNKLNILYCETIKKVVSVFHTAQGVDESLTHPTAVQLITTHSVSILKHIDLDSDAFKTLYSTTVTMGNLTEDELGTEQPKIGEIKRAIEAVFVSSYDRYLDQAKENELALSIKKKAKETLLETKTDEAVQNVDDELPADRDTLNDLIRKEATAQARKMVREEMKAFATRSQKNSNRGLKKQGASKRNTNVGRGSAREGAGRGRGNGRGKSPDNRRTNPRTQRTERNGSNNRSRSQTRTSQRADGNRNDTQSDRRTNRRSRSTSRSKKKGRGGTRRQQRS